MDSHPTGGFKFDDDGALNSSSREDHLQTQTVEHHPSGNTGGGHNMISNLGPVTEEKKISLAT
jgi:hypothetical protein